MKLGIAGNSKHRLIHFKLDVSRRKYSNLNISYLKSKLFGFFSRFGPRLVWGNSKLIKKKEFFFIQKKNKVRKKNVWFISENKVTLNFYRVHNSVIWITTTKQYIGWDADCAKYYLLIRTSIAIEYVVVVVLSIINVRYVGEVVSLEYFIKFAKKKYKLKMKNEKHVGLFWVVVKYRHIIEKKTNSSKC